MSDTTENRLTALHVLMSIAGAYVGVRYWSAHPIAGGVLGFVVGSWTYNLVAGR